MDRSESKKRQHAIMMPTIAESFSLCAPRIKNDTEKHQNDGMCPLFQLSDVNHHQGVHASFIKLHIENVSPNLLF